jgi:hypothetical protein
MPHIFNILYLLPFYVGTAYAIQSALALKFKLPDIKRGIEIMFAKFPFYSVAQMYAISLNTPVAILLGRDNLYWVVDRQVANNYLDEGCALLSAAN